MWNVYASNLIPKPVLSKANKMSFIYDYETTEEAI